MKAFEPNKETYEQQRRVYEAIKLILKKEFGYDYDSEFFTDEILVMEQEIIQAVKTMLLNRLRTMKIKHELPNQNNPDFNVGYVKAISDVLNIIR